MIKVIPIPAFNDNYIWLLQPETPTPGNNVVAVVDPGIAEPVLAMLDHYQLKLGAILVTHHHWDHVQGIPALLEHSKDAVVYGPSNSPVNTITNRLKTNDHFDLPGNLGVCRVITTPGHTLDHISYLIDNHLFCGDTLFSAGCGRLFEGSPELMLDSLNKLSALPTTTYMYPAHEYTHANLQFAVKADPENNAVAEYMSQTELLRKRGIPTLPSTLGRELAVNPFLRCDTTGVRQSVEQYVNRKLLSTSDVFTELRLWKDQS